MIFKLFCLLVLILSTHSKYITVDDEEGDNRLPITIDSKKDKTGCLINQKVCIKHPTFVNSFRDEYGEKSLNASTNIKNCFDRAKHFHTWCCNPENETTSATFLANNEFKVFPENKTLLAESKADKIWVVPDIGKNIYKLNSPLYERIASAALRASDDKSGSDIAYNDVNTAKSKLEQFVEKITMDEVVSDAASHQAVELKEQTKNLRAKAQSALSTILTLMSTISRTRDFNAQSFQRNKLADARRLVRATNTLKTLLDALKESQKKFKNNIYEQLKKNKQTAEETKQKQLTRLSKIDTNLKSEMLKINFDLKKMHNDEVEKIKEINAQNDKEEIDIRDRIKSLQERMLENSKKLIKKTTNSEDQFALDAADSVEKAKLSSERVTAETKTGFTGEMQKQISEAERAAAVHKRTESDVLNSVYSKSKRMEMDRDKLLDSIDDRYNELLQKGKSSLDAFSVAMNEHLVDSIKSINTHENNEADAFIQNRKNFISDFNDYNSFINGLHCKHFSKICNLVGKIKNHVTEQAKCSDKYCSNIALVNSKLSDSNGIQDKQYSKTMDYYPYYTGI